MSDDIEIIDIEDDQPQRTSNGKLLSMLTQESSGDEDDIICLDTVFKPVEKTESTEQNLKQADDSQVKDDSKISTAVPPSKNMTTEQTTTSESKLDALPISETETTNYFSTDEESIDENLVIVPIIEKIGELSSINIPVSNLPVRNREALSRECKNANFVQASSNKLKQTELHYDDKEETISDVSQSVLPSMSSVSCDDEPPYKRLRLTDLLKVASKNYIPKESFLLNDDEVNPHACHFPKPVGTSFFDLIVVILKNCKCLLFGEIWNYISGLFPYFEYHFTVIQGVGKIRRVTQKAPSFFLRTTSGVVKQSKQLLIMLNPVTKKEQHLVTTNILAKRIAIMEAMYAPQYFDSLMAGTLSLTSVDLFRLRKRTVFTVLRTETSEPTLDPPSDAAHEEIYNNPSTSYQAAEPRSNNNTPNYRSPQISTANEDPHVAQEEKEPDTTSNSSTDTVVFDPKIINCRSLNQDELENMFQFDLNVDGIVDNSNKEFQGGFKDMASNLLGQFDNGSFNRQSFVSNSAFANTVWTTDEAAPLKNKKKPTVDPLLAEQKNSTNPPPSFPEVEQCVPKWKQIFPWMSWKPWVKKIFCTTCQDIHDYLNSGERTIVMEILHPDDVFKVSKQLRAHSDKTSHKMAIILQNKGIISTIYFLINSHFNEFNSINEILTVLEDLFGKSSIVSEDILKCALSMLGQYLEDRVLKSLKIAKKFSIITDPCAGLLIVRWLNESNEPEEHIVSSFSSINKTPSEYLGSLGINLKYLVSYVTNARCEECNRCKLTKKAAYKNSTPLRLPQMDRYLVFLWRRKLLKPFYSLGTALCKLWLSFPHKFIEVGKIISWDKLTKFPSSPDTFIEVFQHFEKFKEIAANIYSLTGSLEALGLQKIDLSKYVWILDLFPILTNINILLMEIKVVNPFLKDFDDLSTHVEKLQTFCEKIKADIKSKKLDISVSIADIDDVFYVVHMTAKEFQQPIYHKGKSVSLAYNRVTAIQNLENCTSNPILQNTFIVLFTAIKSHFRYDDIVLKKSLTSFLKDHSILQRKSAPTVLELFQGKKEMAKDYHVVLTFYRLIALFPFQPAKFERCLYEIKIYEYLFYRSAWASIGPNGKEYLLTIISELNGKHLLSEREMREWWREKIKS